jgi:hypothetical protein
LNKLLGYKFSTFMVATVRELGANLVQQYVHVGLNPIVKVAHAPISSA